MGKAWTTPGELGSVGLGRSPSGLDDHDHLSDWAELDPARNIRPMPLRWDSVRANSASVVVIETAGKAPLPMRAIKEENVVDPAVPLIAIPLSASHSVIGRSRWKP